MADERLAQADPNERRLAAPTVVKARGSPGAIGDGSSYARIMTDRVRVVIGRSGAGKSTFLRILGGFDDDADGTLLVPRRRAIVFQAPRLIPWKRVLPNVVFGLEDRDRAERGRQALREVGLEDHATAWPGTLSGGEAQRVALARAFVREPELLLLDEPFGALDALTRLRMHALVADLRREASPGHAARHPDVEQAFALSDRVVLLFGGRIVTAANGAPPSPARVTAVPGAARPAARGSGRAARRVNRVSSRVAPTRPLANVQGLLRDP